MKTIANTFCADIAVPNGAAPARVVMTGAHLTTAEESLEKGLKYAAYYVHDTNGPCYAWADTIVHCLCGSCRGKGRRQKTRGGKPMPFSWFDCKDCLASGSLFCLIPVRTEGPLAQLLKEVSS